MRLSLYLEFKLRDLACCFDNTSQNDKFYYFLRSRQGLSGELGKPLLAANGVSLLLKVKRKARLKSLKLL